MKAEEIKVGKRYRIRFDGFHNGEQTGKYSGSGRCTNPADFGTVTFDRLAPKLRNGLSEGTYALDDIVEEIIPGAKKAKPHKRDYNEALDAVTGEVGGFKLKLMGGEPFTSIAKNFRGLQINLGRAKAEARRLREDIRKLKLERDKWKRLAGEHAAKLRPVNEDGLRL